MAVYLYRVNGWVDQRGLVFLFSGNHIWLPSFLFGGWFYGFFFLSGFLAKKKNRQPNFFSIPKLEKIQTCLGKNHEYLLHGFFFFVPNPERKKKTVKLSPSYLFFQSTDSFVCDYRIKKKPTPFESTKSSSVLWSYFNSE